MPQRHNREHRHMWQQRIIIHKILVLTLQDLCEICSFQQGCLSTTHCCWVVEDHGLHPLLVWFFRSFHLVTVWDRTSDLIRWTSDRSPSYVASYQRNGTSMSKGNMPHLTTCWEQTSGWKKAVVFMPSFVGNLWLGHLWFNPANLFLHSYMHRMACGFVVR